MSGLEAIGAAAAILQFVEFGSKLLITGYDVYKSQEGATSQTIHIQNLCTELQTISSQLSQAPAGNITLNEKEKSLWRLADKAHDPAYHLGLLLNSLKLRKSTFRSWGAIRQSWRLLQEKENIADMTSQLNEVRSSMDTVLLVLLRDDTSLLIKLVNDQTQRSKHLHNDNMDAIQLLKRELLATMQQHRGYLLQSHDTLLHTLGDQLAKLACRSTALDKSERILESLYCEEVYRRKLGVSDAEDRTFSWAFDSWCTGHRFECGCSCTQALHYGPDVRCTTHYKIGEPPCAGQDTHQKHLLNWLECNVIDPFMITGKPGSGKSTFMKFIVNHEQTRRALDAWSGTRKLVIAKFYFWSSGTPLQRSRDGLLRCLLYRILSQTPDAIPIAVPHRWQTADQPRAAEPWSRKEISDAFTNVVSAHLLETNFCFFIDGLDEYGGSDLESNESDLDLVLLLRTLASSPHVKICLSSRPRNIFQGYFPCDGPHHITLHDHTTKDIEQLVESRIERVQRLINIEADDLEELKNMIVERSSGGFLWVVLVVRELLNGLEPPFSMLELESCLLLLPETLDGYFQRILSKVNQQYRRFNVRLLLICTHHETLLIAYVHFLWLMELDGKNSHFPIVPATVQPESRCIFQNWQENTSSRIKRLCGDFLAIEENTARGVHIEHNHRSVVDFLRLPAVKKELLILAEWNAALYEQYSGTACADLLYKLDNVLCSRQSPSDRHWTNVSLEMCHPEWKNSEVQALLLFALYNGLTLFAEQAIGNLAEELQTAILNDLLRATVVGYCIIDPDIGNTPATFEFLCSKGANLNSVARATSASEIPGDIDVEEGPCSPIEASKHEAHPVQDSAEPINEPTNCTIWEMYLQKREFGVWYPYGNHFVVDLAVRLIEAGADLSCRLPKGCGSVQ